MKSLLTIAAGALLLAAACSHVPTREELAHETPSTLAGDWVAVDEDGTRHELHLENSGEFWSLTAHDAASACRAVGYFWVEDGRLVRRYRTNDCDPGLAGHAKAVPIMELGGSRLGLGANGDMRAFRRR